MADVFCNQLRAPQPAGAELLLVVRRAARARAARTPTTITFCPSSRPTPASDELTVELDEVPAGTGRARREAGPERRLAVRPRRATSPPPAATPRATSSSTTSPCPAATPRSSATATATGSATSARSTAPTSTASGSTRRRSTNGDELQIGKFKLVFFAGERAMP